MSQPSPMPPTPPLLLTKRLNAFLRANQSPQLPTLLLTTAHGKLLAHASPHPVAQLRTHATVAASLLAIHASSSVDVPSALPGACTSDPVAGSPVAGADDDADDSDDDDDGDNDEPPGPDDRRRAHADGRAQARRRGAARPVKPAAVTLQLSGGTVVIRRLKCGLLLVTIGPPAHDHQSEQHAHQHHRHHQHPHHENGDPSGSPSEVESLASAGGQTTSSLESAGAASVVALRRHAGELARWLDDKLDTLQVPEDDGSLVSD